jgi:hypothetical protein
MYLATRIKAPTSFRAMIDIHRSDVHVKSGRGLRNDMVGDMSRNVHNVTRVHNIDAGHLCIYPKRV